MLEAGANNFDAPNRDRDALSTIGYTSGTTGHPKGAMQSHKAVMSNAALTAMIHRRIHEDIVVSALPCAHVYGNVVLNGAFLYGYIFVLVPRFEETAVLAAIQENRATLYDGVPTSYMMLMAHPDFAKYDLSSINRLTVGGQTIPVATGEEVEERFGAPLLELWGTGSAPSAPPCPIPNAVSPTWTTHSTRCRRARSVSSCARGRSS